MATRVVNKEQAGSKYYPKGQQHQEGGNFLYCNRVHRLEDNVILSGGSSTLNFTECGHFCPQQGGAELDDGRCKAAHAVCRLRLIFTRFVRTTLLRTGLSALLPAEFPVASERQRQFDSFLCHVVF